MDWNPRSFHDFCEDLGMLLLMACPFMFLLVALLMVLGAVLHPVAGR